MQVGYSQGTSTSNVQQAARLSHHILISVLLCLINTCAYCCMLLQFEIIKNAWNSLTEAAETVSATPVPVPVNDGDKAEGLFSAKRRALEHILKQKGVGDSSAIDREINLFLDWNNDTIEDDGLLFWKRKHQDFPNLKIVARHYLSISASSVAVECMFSTTGYIVNSRRSSLSPAKLNFISFVHDNSN